jgi:uncharacterized protein YidB (DUF937 family)
MDELGRMQGGPAGGTTGGGAGGDIAGAIGGLVGGQGGLQGLLDTLGRGGLQDVAQSWVGTGGNQSVDPDRLGAALGPDRVNQLSQQSGLSIPQLLPMLAGALPAIIDRLTPDGRVPAGDATAGNDIGGMLQGLSASAGGDAGSPLGQLGGLLGGDRR